MAKKAVKKTLDDKTIVQITQKLAHFLSDTYVLYIKTQNFHWNMSGPEFFMYHRLLEEQYKELAEAIDELAERIRMLGQLAPGSMKQFLELSSLKESPVTLKWDAMIKELVGAHEEMIEHCHALIAFTDEVEDQGTSDLLIERIRAHSKQAWLLRSHFTK